ncbi:hypothetical protein SGRIM128S_03939 [Streptomyces griseomycini]
MLLPAAALYGFLTWWFTHFAVTEWELRIRTGLLFRRTAHIRLERIRPSTSPSRCSRAWRAWRNSSSTS